MHAREVATSQLRIAQRPQSLSRKRCWREQIFYTSVENLIERPSDEVIATRGRQQPHRHRVGGYNRSVHGQRERPVVEEVNELRPRVEAHDVSRVMVL